MRLENWCVDLFLSKKYVSLLMLNSTIICQLPKTKYAMYVTQPSKTKEISMKIELIISVSYD